MTIYQVRRNADPKNPADRGVLVREFRSYSEANAYCTKMHAEGDATAFVAVVN